MRRLASFLLLGVALTAGAADIWRWKDAEGVVHYSDTPVAGAERIVVAGSQPSSESSRPAPAPATITAPGKAPAAQTVRYTRCAITQPENDQVFFAINSVDASVAVEPYLQPGHRVQVLLNGSPYAKWPESATGATLTDLNRGSYTLAVRVVDANGRALCTGPVINFHVRQPSIYSPQSPQAPKAPAAPRN
jgi:hypothetical protein